MPSKPSNSSKQSQSRHAKKYKSPIKHESEISSNSEKSSDEEMVDGSINDEENYRQQNRKTHETVRKYVHMPSPRPPSPSYEKFFKQNETTTRKRKNFMRKELLSGEVVPESAELVNLGAQKASLINSLSQHWLAWIALAVIIFSLMIRFAYIPFHLEDQSNRVSIKSITEEFPEQDRQFWQAIVTGINATVLEKYPTSYLFLFESKAEETTKKLIKQVSEYAVCKLSKCGFPAVDFNEVLKNFSDNDDYGSVLTHLRTKLENNGLLVVENLDEVPEKFALAFHNLCDEISPLVEKSAYFFTMKVDRFNETREELRYTEKLLKKKWVNMEDDKFSPLFTRISSMPLRVNPPKRS